MAVDGDFFAMRAPRQADRERLAAIFRADAARERARAVRSLLVHLVAVLSGPVWLVALQPARFSPALRQAALAAWAAAFLAALLAFARETWCRRQRARGMATLPPTVLKTPGACAGDADAES